MKGNERKGKERKGNERRGAGWVVTYETNITHIYSTIQYNTSINRALFYLHKTKFVYWWVRFYCPLSKKLTKVNGMYVLYRTTQL
jgi:hypothetical protein